MKNKIISLILVVVVCTLALTGCAFNYQKKDLSAYASFDKAAFEELLKSVEVEDSDFKLGDEEARAAMVKDEIYDRLASLADDEDKVTTGTLAEKDILYYCYYVTAVFEESVEDSDEKEEKTYTFYATNMTASKFQTLVLHDLSKTVDKAIMDAVLGEAPFSFDDEGAYVTKTEGVSAGGKVVYVSYKATPNGGTAVEYTNARVELPAEDDGTFAGYLVGKDIAKTLTETEIDEVKYTDIKISWMVESGKDVVVEFEENPFTSTTSQKSDNGTTKNLKDAKSVTYHVYPVGRQAIEELTEENGKLIFTTLLGDGIATSSLDCFANEDYKYTDDNGDEVTIKSLITELVEKYKTLSDAETAYDKDKDNTTLKENYENAQAAVAADKLDECWAKMVKCAETAGDDLSKVMYDEYVEDVYDELAEEYNDEIADKVTVVLWEMIQENVKNVTAPERAVKDAYNHNLESFKYTYYTGNVDDSTSSDAVANVDEYATFRDYLIVKAQEIAKEELGRTDTIDTYEKACDVMGHYAETQVKEYIVVWTIAKAYDIEVVDTEIENFALIQSYYMQIYGMSITSDQIIEQYGEENIRTYLAFDKVMAHFLETKADDAETEDVDESDASEYVNITVVRK